MDELAESLLKNLKSNREDPDALDAEKFERSRKVTPSRFVKGDTRTPPALAPDGTLADPDKKR